MNVFPLNDLTVALESELNYVYNNDYTELFGVSYDLTNKWFDFDVIMINVYIDNENEKKKIYTVEQTYISEIKYNINCDNEVDLEKLEDLYFNDSSKRDWQTVAIFDNYNKTLEYCHKILQVDTLEKQLKKDGYKLI